MTKVFEKINLIGNSVVITGGCGGIGLASARELLQNGISVLALVDINFNKNAIEALQMEFNDRFINFYKIDITRQSEVKEFFKTFIAIYKRIDILICSAGILNEYKPEETIQINLIGSISTIQEAMNYMCKLSNGQGGSIFAIASLASVMFPSFCPVYAASKHGLLGYMKSMAGTYNTTERGVNFVTICAGITSTSFSMNMKERLYPEFVAHTTRKFVQHNIQTPEQFAKCFIEIIIENKNGSVWTVDCGKCKEFLPITYELEEYL